LPLSAVNVDRVGLSDSGPFLSARIPVIDFHSLTQDTLPVLHSSRDAFAAVKGKDYIDSYNLIVAYLAYLDLALSSPN